MAKLIKLLPFFFSKIQYLRNRNKITKEIDKFMIRRKKLWKKEKLPGLTEFVEKC